jgi:SAM-dependent methyltransferase
MTSQAGANSATGPDVLDYYARNWQAIANCYALDARGFPVDVAWYRRRLYNDFLERRKPASVLDIGCGGGWTVLDALEKGLDARGIEPVAELKAHGCDLLQKHGHDADRIQQADLAMLSTLPSQSVDCIALLSVLAHVPVERWDEVHREIARVLRPGGWFVTAYRNELFDLFTFNSLTLEFYDKSLWGCEPCEPLRTGPRLELLKGLITNPDLPGPYFTAAEDKSFGQLRRVKSNPLTMPAYLGEFGLRVDRTAFYHFHCVPPLMASQVDDYQPINHQLELTMSTDWRGTFMCAMFFVEAARP